MEGSCASVCVAFTCEHMHGPRRRSLDSRTCFVFTREKISSRRLQERPNATS